MKRETCIECEKTFANLLISEWDLDLALDQDTSKLDKPMCLKCIQRILNRFTKTENNIEQTIDTDIDVTV